MLGRTLLTATLLLGTMQANAGWREDALSDLKAFKQPSQPVAVPSAQPPVPSPVLPTPSTYQSSYELDRAREELEERERARAEVKKAQRRLQSTLRKIHEDACQRAYDHGVPYDVLERYCQ